MTDHDRIEELLALEALGALEGEDAQALARALQEHGPDCPECSGLRRELGDVAGRLAFALDPVAVRADISEEILTAEPGKPLHRVHVFRPGLGAAAAAALIALGAVGGYLLTPRQQSEVAALAEFLSRADVRVVRFEGAGGNVSAAVAPRQGFLFASDLEPLPEGHVYELWMIRGDTAVQALCLEPRDGVVVGRFEGDVTGSDALAVTVEPASCPSSPTTDPIFVAPLQV
ncbi:MAG: anti-sigma factor domain-containing protein [Actinomycetota bacterium]